MMKLGRRSARSARHMRRAWLVSCFLLGCAGSAASSRPAGPAMEMDAVVIRTAPPNDLPTDVYDADTVLHYAHEAERAGDFAKAKRLYQRLLDEFPTSKLKRNARFGLGRAQEGV